MSSSRAHAQLNPFITPGVYHLGSFGVTSTMASHCIPSKCLTCFSGNFAGSPGREGLASHHGPSFDAISIGGYLPKTPARAAETHAEDVCRPFGDIKSVHYYKRKGSDPYCIVNFCSSADAASAFQGLARSLPDGMNVRKIKTSLNASKGPTPKEPKSREAECSSSSGKLCKSVHHVMLELNDLYVLCKRQQ